MSEEIKEFEPILAQLEHISSSGKSNWYEVIFYLRGWKSYAGSRTFEDGEKVIKWEYCNKLLNQQDNE